MHTGPVGGEDRWESLVGDLEWVVMHLLRHAYKQAGDKDEREHPALAGVVRGIVGEQQWRSRPNLSLVETVGAAINGLPKTFTERPQKGTGKKTQVPGDCLGAPEREIAEVIFGFRDDELTARFGRDRELFTYKYDYYPAAKERAGLDKPPPKTPQRMIRVIREDLADALLALEQKTIKQRELAIVAAPVADQDITLVSPAADPDLIVRYQYITEVLRRVLSEDKRNFNCVCIWGEPGTGKTVLADQVARALKYEPVTRLRVGNPEVFQDDLSAFFITEGIEPGNWSESDRRAHFQSRLSKSSPGRLKTEIVIIDNVEDDTLIDRLVPPDPRVPVFLTMRHRPGDPRNKHVGPRDSRIKHVELENFSEAEACAFIRRRIDGPDTDVLALARVLGCRPLALDQAVRFIREVPDITLRELVQALTVDLQSNLALVTPPEDREQNLIQLYKLILASLADDQSALDVLRSFLAIAGKSAIENRGSLLLYIQHHPREPHDRLYYYAGLRTLARLGLLREDVDSRHADNVMLVMHSLTYRILRDLEAPTVFRIEADYLDVLGNLAIGESEPRKELQGAEIMARLRAWAGMVGRHIAPEDFRYFSVVDEETWVAIREAPDEHDTMQPYTVRYEVYPHGFYKVDYRDGRRSLLNPVEVEQLCDLITAYYQAVMPELDKVRAPAPDEADDGEPADRASTPCRIQARPAQAYAHQLGSIATFFENIFISPPFNWVEQDRDRGRQILTYVAMLPPAYTTLAVATDEEQLHGAAYGHAIFPGLSWWDNFEEPLPLEQITEWSQHTFILRQVAVAEEWRGHGIGRRLVEDILGSRPEQRATVAIPRTASGAVSFFMAMGWRHVGQKTRRISGLPAPHDILLIELRQGHE